MSYGIIAQRKIREEIRLNKAAIKRNTQQLTRNEGILKRLRESEECLRKK